MASQPGDPRNTAAWKRARTTQLAAEPDCAYCGNPATTVDHIIPLSKGGEPYAPHNLASACKPCNLAKRDHIYTGQPARKRKTNTQNEGQPTTTPSNETRTTNHESFRGRDTGAGGGSLSSTSDVSKDSAGGSLPNSLVTSGLGASDGWELPSVGETLRSKVPVVGVVLPRVRSPRLVGVDEVEAVNETARLYMGIEFDPWQLEFVQAITVRTVGPGGVLSKLPSEAGLMIARQNGKSTVMQAYCLHRLLEGKRVLSAAQNLTTGEALWSEVVEPLFDPKNPDAPLRDMVAHINRRNSAIGITLKNGGAWLVRAANPNSARGLKAIDLLWMDESRWLTSFDAYSALNPTTTTSPQRQVIQTSNAGGLDSVFLNSWAARGRKRAAGWDNGDRITWLEWSADEARDLDDRDGWAQANPNLGHRFDMDTLEDDYRTYEAANNVNGWRSERLCQTVGSLEGALDLVAFNRLGNPDQTPLTPTDTHLVMGFAIDINRRGGVTMIGKQLPDGRVQMQVLTHWAAEVGETISDRDMADRIVTEYETWRPGKIVYNSFVSAGVAHLLTRARLPLFDLKGRKYFDSCQILEELIRTGNMVHDGHPICALHSGYVVKEQLRNGEGSFFSRRLSPGPIYTVDCMAMISHPAARRIDKSSRVVTLAS